MSTPANINPTDASDIIGRGSRESAQMMRDWFTRLNQAAETGEKSAYVFVLGNMCEILQTFDMPIVFPEVTSLQTAVRGTAKNLLISSEDYGFSADVCGYVKVDAALHLEGREHPMGKIPKPGLAVMSNGCNTYFKWAEFWERMYEDMKFVTIDVPNERSRGTLSMPGSDDYAFELKYVVGQIKEFIGICEEVTGRKFDIDKFRIHLGYANTMSHYWKKLLELNHNSPAVFSALTDGTAFLGIANCFRATKQGADYFKHLYEEMAYRSQKGIGVTMRKDGKDVPYEQKFRLGLMGVPCYPIFHGLNELFSEWGGVFVTSSYLKFASGGAALDFQFDLDNPIESFAEGTMQTVRSTQSGLLFNYPDIEAKSTPFNLDGLVYHGVKSCRTASSSLADRRFHNGLNTGLPSLYLESDIVDPRAVSIAQMKNRVDAFFEGLISRQQKERAAS